MVNLNLLRVVRKNKMELPKFVKLNNIALRLVDKYYYRDGGHWTVGYKIVDSVLLSWTHGMGMPRLHKKPLIEITEDEWRKDNKQYVPLSFSS